MVRHEVLHLTMYVQLCIALIHSVYPCMYSIHKVVDGPLMFKGILYMYVAFYLTETRSSI